MPLENMAGRDSPALAAASYAWGYRDVGEKSEIGLVVVQTLALSSPGLWSFVDQSHRLISALSTQGLGSAQYGKGCEAYVLPAP